MRKKKTNVPDEVIVEMESIIDTLNAASYDYYVTNDSSMSDSEFDKLMNHLKELETEYKLVLPGSPTVKVGSDIQTEFKKVERTVPMLSIDNTYSVDDLRKWMQGVNESLGKNDTVFSLEYKYDGVSCSLIYEDGVLVEASTRGDGYVGDDITENAKTIESIPKSIPDDFKSVLPSIFEVRGEVLMLHSVLNEINKEREANGEKPFANCRNIASGSIKNLDPNVTASRKLVFKPYYVVYPKGSEDNEYLKNFNSQVTSIILTKYLGFAPDEIKFAFRVTDDLNRILDIAKQLKDKEDFDSDGVVIKVCMFDDQKALGEGTKSPKWAIAYKGYAQEKRFTRLNGVEWNVGRTGKVTPVGLLSPIEIDGVTVSRATLNNIKYINDLNIHINDMVYVERGGMVIPKITGVNTDYANICKGQIIEISKCPVCGSDLITVTNNDGSESVDLYCPNKECPSVIKARLQNFASMFDIDGLGTAMLSLLIDNNLVKRWTDIFTLKDKIYEMIYNCKLTEYSGKKLIASIQSAKESAFASTLLASMGIELIGKQNAIKIMNIIESIDKLVDYDYAKDPLKIEQTIGKVAYANFKEYLTSEQGVSELKFIIDNGFNLTDAKKASEVKEDAPLKGLRLLATGTFKNFTRESIVTSIEENGGTYANGVNKKLDILVCGEKVGAAKIKKAKELNIKMINESEYLSMIGA